MIIKVKVKPGSDRKDVVKIGEDSYEIHVKERAEDNKANKRVVNMLSKYFDVDFRKIRIKNLKSREKIIEISL